MILAASVTSIVAPRFPSCAMGIVEVDETSAGYEPM
jgi:hypothetical protein